jgi:hypothetical protein
MNISVDARYRRQIAELWNEWQRTQLPPKRPGEFRLDILCEPPMHGPDERNLLNFVRAPEDFVQILKDNHIPYKAN